MGWRAGADLLAAGPRSLAARPTQHRHWEIAYYVCYGPHRIRLIDLARIAGSRWPIEESFQQAKQEAGLHDYQVRDWRAWHAHITLAMATHALLAAAKTLATQGDPALARA